MLTRAAGGITGSLPDVIGGVLGGITGSLPSLPTVPGTGTPGTGTGTGIGGITPGNGGVQVVSHVTHGLNEAVRTLRASSTAKQGMLAQTGFYDPFLLVSGVLLLAAGAATRFFERR